MNRITSPLNVASLIFIVLTIVCVSEVRSSQRRAAYDAATVAYLDELKTNRDTYFYRVKAQLPVQAEEGPEPIMITSVEYSDSCVLFRCNYDNSRYSKSASDCCRLRYSGDNPELSVLKMLSKTFAPEVVDCLIANNLDLRIISTYKGELVEDYVLTPEMLHIGYCHTYYDGRLKRWLKQQKKE